MIRERTVYETPDKQRFDDIKAAEAHEAKERARLLPLLSQLWGAWTNDCGGRYAATEFIFEHHKVLQYVIEYPSTAAQTVAEFLGETEAQDEAA